MIRCKNGHLNPDGATYCSVCKAYIDSSAQAVPVESKPEDAAPAADTDLSAELSPKESKGRTVGSHELTVRNPAGTPAQVSITAAAAEKGVAVEVEPSTLAIVPGGSALARVRVRPRGSQWFGRRVHRFQVTVSPNLVLDGAMAQRARVPIVVILLVAAALAGLGVFLATRGGSSEGTPTTATEPTTGGGTDTGTTTAAAVSYRDEVMKDHPRAYWSLDETSGTAAADNSGNGNTGRYVGGVRLGQPGALTTPGDLAPEFDGVDGQVVVPPLHLHDFTLEAWVRLTGPISSDDAIGRGPFVPHAQDVNFDEERLRIFQPPASCAGRPHIPNEQCWDVLVSPVKAIAGRWTFWVITRSGSTARLYMDGKPVPALTVPWDDEFIFRAIAHARTGYTSGSIDEVAVYDHALGASRVLAHFEAR